MTFSGSYSSKLTILLDLQHILYLNKLSKVLEDSHSCSVCCVSMLTPHTHEGTQLMEFVSVPDQPQAEAWNQHVNIHQVVCGRRGGTVVPRDQVAIKAKTDRSERNAAKTLPVGNFEELYWHSGSSDVSLFGTIIHWQ